MKIFLYAYIYVHILKGFYIKQHRVEIKLLDAGIQDTGWPKSKFEICFGFNSDFWPYVGKAKLDLGGVSFLFSNDKQTAGKWK